jgi:hypothetical protein
MTELDITLDSLVDVAVNAFPVTDGIVVAVDDTIVIGVVALALLLVMLVIVIPCGLIAVADADNIEPLVIAEFDIALDALVETVVNAFPVADGVAVVV